MRLERGVGAQMPAATERHHEQCLHPYRHLQAAKGALVRTWMGQVLACAVKLTLAVMCQALLDIWAASLSKRVLSLGKTCKRKPSRPNAAPLRGRTPVHGNVLVRTSIEASQGRGKRRQQAGCRGQRPERRRHFQLVQVPPRSNTPSQRCVGE